MFEFCKKGGGAPSIVQTVLVLKESHPGNMSTSATANQLKCHIDVDDSAECMLRVRGLEPKGRASLEHVLSCYGLM